MTGSTLPTPYRGTVYTLPICAATLISRSEVGSPMSGSSIPLVIGLNPGLVRLTPAGHVCPLFGSLLGRVDALLPGADLPALYLFLVTRLPVNHMPFEELHERMTPHLEGFSADLIPGHDRGAGSGPLTNPEGSGAYAATCSPNTGQYPDKTM